MNLKKILASTGLGACIAISTTAQAQAPFPNRAVTIIVPFAPGGNIDIVARALSVPLSKLLKQPVVVDNRPGGSSAVAAALVANAPKDGYTLMLTGTGTLATVPLMIKAPYAAKDITPVALVARTSVVLVAKATDPRFQSFDGLQKTMGSRLAQLSGGHPAVGSPNHLALLQLENALHTRITAVPYRGSGPGLIDVIAGHLDLYFDQVTSSVPYINAGKLRGLAIFGPSRDPSLPDVKTLAELGFPGIDATTYTGIFAPTGTPGAVTKLLEEAVIRATHEESFMNTLKGVGGVPSGAPGKQLAGFVEAENKVATELIKQGRLQPEQ